jgi:hypothetical protein
VAMGGGSRRAVVMGVDDEQGACRWRVRAHVSHRRGGRRRRCLWDEESAALGGYERKEI